MGLLKDEGVLLITPWLPSCQTSLWMGIRESQLVWYCCPWNVVVVMDICCNPRTEESSERPGKVDSCLISSISKAAIKKPISTLLHPSYTLCWDTLCQGCAEPRGQSQRSAFATHSQQGSLRPPVQLAVCISLLLQKDRWVLFHYSLMDPVSTRALYCCGSDRPGYRIHTVQ